MFDNIITLKDEIISKINEAVSFEEIENVRQKYLSKKGELSKLMQSMKDLPNEDKPKFGKLVNEAKDEIEELLSVKVVQMKEVALLNKMEEEKIDITIPGDNI